MLLLIHYFLFFYIKDAGLQWLSNTFHLCSPLKNLQDASMLKSWLSETWVDLAMVDYPYKADFLQPLPAWPVQVIEDCLGGLIKAWTVEVFST